MGRNILLGILLISTIFLLFQPFPFIEGFSLIMSCLIALWLITQYTKDVSIIDFFWGMGFLIIVWFYQTRVGHLGVRSLLFTMMVTVWALRLSLYLSFRGIGKEEDFRYRNWRQKYGRKWWWVSFVRVFLAQGLITWVASALFIPAMNNPGGSFTAFDYIGIYLWIVGFIFEAGSDWQMFQFKKDPKNREKVLSKGFWAMTRHPNYFGDALIWCGYYLFACSSGQYIYFFCPLVMIFLVTRVSGIPYLEKKMMKTKPDYADYIKNVPAFFPNFRNFGK